MQSLNLPMSLASDRSESDSVRTESLYTIPLDNLEALKHKVEVLNRRVVRLGLDEKFAIHLECGNPYTANPDNKYIRAIPVVDITISGESLRVGDWRLVGILEPMQMEDKSWENVVHTVPGEAVPLVYRSYIGTCEHCGIKRKRTQTFVVRDNSRHENTKVVGRSCLRDFLGHQSPDALAAYAEILCELDQSIRNLDRLYGEKSPDYYDLREFLLRVIHWITDNPWMSRTAAANCDHRVLSTADCVLDTYNPKSGSYAEFGKRLRNNPITPAQQELASTVIEWASSLTDAELDESSYLANLNTIARAGYCTRRLAGYAASLVVAYRKAHGLHAKGNVPDRKDRIWLGKVGQNCEFFATVDTIQKIDGQYGYVGIHRMFDDSGNVLIWFATGAPNKWLREKSRYKFTAYVKTHDEYRGTKQTVINRLKDVMALNPLTSQQVAAEIEVPVQPVPVVKTKSRIAQEEKERRETEELHAELALKEKYRQAAVKRAATIAAKKQVAEEEKKKKEQAAKKKKSVKKTAKKVTAKSTKKGAK